MKKNVLIAPNAFKECADSVDTAGIIKSCFNTNDYDVHILPLSDGGDGFLRVCGQKFNAKIATTVLPIPAGEKQIIVPFGICNNAAYIESAKVAGLTLIPRQDRNPLFYNTSGMGLLLKHVARNFQAISDVFIGIGGTGTNDLGIGAASVMGLKLFDADNIELAPLPVNYWKVNKIVYPAADFPFRLKAVVDVNNKLLGGQGATRMFAGQKGASEENIALMEKGFENICSILERDGIITSADILSGSGGGLAAGLQSFFKCQLVYAKDFILTELGLQTFKKNTDIVITGEGRFDRQSLMNKAPGIVVNYFKDQKGKVFIICGSAEDNIKSFLPEKVRIIELKKFFGTTEASIKNFSRGINLACEIIKETV